MRGQIVFLTVIFLLCGCQNSTDLEWNNLPQTPFESGKGNTTATYQQILSFYQTIAEKSSKVAITPWGETDSGNPLHLVMYAANGIFDAQSAKESGNLILLINNGIHPGEPCGIDASMLLLKNLLTNSVLQQQTKNMYIAIIPVYNIGGCLNRDTLGRVNQVGPESYGFRGNAANYNLNRDFTKLDTKNSRTFAELFHALDPDVFLDTHTSDGADYQHTMTLIPTQPDALGQELGSYFRNEFLPQLYSKMAEKNYPMTPYVWPIRKTPKEGIRGFYDSPRYSSGYASLFQCLSFESEAHMLKPFERRVDATLKLMLSTLEVSAQEKDKIIKNKAIARNEMMEDCLFKTGWKADTSRYSLVPFQGFDTSYFISPATNLPVLFYDTTKSYEKQIPYYEYFLATDTLNVPKAYIIPQAWHRVIEMLTIHGVEMHKFQNDTSLSVTAYRISKTETYKQSFEGHYPHYNTQVEPYSSRINFRAGDVWIETQQKRKRFIMEMLEPICRDSYFNWNFFDPILEQKEYFGEYYFSLIAKDILKNNPELAAELKLKRLSNPLFAKSNRSQLQFIYENSSYQEPGFMRYPVFRIEK